MRPGTAQRPLPSMSEGLHEHEVGLFVFAGAGCLCPGALRGPAAPRSANSVRTGSGRFDGIHFVDSDDGQ